MTFTVVLFFFSSYNVLIQSGIIAALLLSNIKLIKQLCKPVAPGSLLSVPLGLFFPSVPTMWSVVFFPHLN